MTSSARSKDSSKRAMKGSKRIKKKPKASPIYHPVPATPTL
jgi:hypothetical protein